MNFFSEKQKNREENSALSIVKLEPNIYIYIYIYIYKRLILELARGEHYS